MPQTYEALNKQPGFVCRFGVWVDGEGCVDGGHCGGFQCGFTHSLGSGLGEGVSFSSGLGVGGDRGQSVAWRVLPGGPHCLGLVAGQWSALLPHR